MPAPNLAQPFISPAQAHGFAGDVSPKEAFQALQENPTSVLIDVRTEGEWKTVGIPNLGEGKQARLLSYLLPPDMQLNPAFNQALSEAVPDTSAALYFLCKTGGRSTAAAKQATALGYAQCYNIAGGFEGEADAQGQRGTINGWKAEGLPWQA